MTIMKFVFTKKLIHLLGASLVTSLNLLAFNIEQSYAETCTSFPVIGGEQNETKVTKTVSQPSLPIPVPAPIPLPGVEVNNNWNTDFSIMPLRQYKHPHFSQTWRSQSLEALQNQGFNPL